MNRYKRMRDISISIAIFLVLMFLTINLFVNKNINNWDYQTYEMNQKKFNEDNNLTQEIIKQNINNFNDFQNEIINEKEYYDTILEYSTLDANFMIVNNKKIQKYLLDYLENKDFKLKTLYVSEPYIDAIQNHAPSYLIITTKDEKYMQVSIATIISETEIIVKDFIEENKLDDVDYVLAKINHLTRVYKTQLE